MFITIPIKILVNIYRYVFILNTIKIYNHTVIFFSEVKKFIMLFYCLYFSYKSAVH